MKLLDTVEALIFPIVLVVSIVFSILFSSDVDASDIISKVDTPDIELHHNSYVKNAFDKMIKAAGIPKGKIKLVYHQHNNLWNAMFNDRGGKLTIEIYNGIVNFDMKYVKGELEYVIAHEIGHWVLGHTRHNIVKCSYKKGAHKECELDADRYAARLIQKVGINGCVATRTWSTMLKKFGDIKENDSHPTYRERAKDAKRYCK